MFAVTELTLRKMKEPAFFCLIALVIVLSAFAADFDPLADQFDSDSLLTPILAGSRSYSILSGTCFAFFISVVMAAFSGATEIPRDISSGLILILLSKPVPKHRYLLGKYFAVILTCLLFFTLAMLTIWTTHFFSSGVWYPPALILRQFQLALAFLPFMALVLLLSCFVGDIAALVFSVLYLLFSLFFNFYPLFIAILPKNFEPESVSAIAFLYYFFPNFLFYFSSFPACGLALPALILYSLASASIFLCIASLRIETMDLNAAR